MKTRKSFIKMWVRAASLCILILGTVASLTPPPATQGGGKSSSGPGLTVPITLESVTKPSTELTPDPLRTLLVLASLDGSLTAVDRVSGALRWVSKDEPMIKVPSGPTSAKAPYFLPDPRTGSLYVMSKNSVRKLQFTIPQLVAMAPCKNSEGLLYTGRKLDFWLQLNPHTGEKSEFHGDSSTTCPAKSADVKDADHDDQSCTSTDALPGLMKKSLLIGKTEYTLSMAEGPRKWNVTYHHYSSSDMPAQAAQDYDLVHFTSPSTGAVLTYDRESGQLLWQKELESPVIAVYTVDCDSSNLISVPFNPIAPETLTRLKSDTSSSNKPLSSTTFVGESNYGMYAVPTLVDELVMLISGEAVPHPPLIEGPDKNENDTPTTATGTTLPNKDNNNKDQNQNPQLSNGSSSPGDTDFVIYGYYDVAEPTGKPPVMQIGQSPNHHIDSLPPGQFNESHFDIPGGFLSPGQDARAQPSPQHNSNLEFSEPVPLTSGGSSVEPPPVSATNNGKVSFPPFPMPNQPPPPISPVPTTKEIKPIKIVFTTAAISVGVTIITIIAGTIAYRRFYPRHGDAHRTSTKSSSKSQKSNDEKKKKVSDSEEEPSTSMMVKKSKKSADGLEISIGKISFAPSSILGKGCEGTFVFKGKFEDRDVAVKRILPECFAFADREVDLLKESDQHPNVIRYFCTEADDQFRYIALELCEATLADWIEGKFPCPYLDPVQVLREATDGLAHLHALRIVHRDIKPANVLISMSGSGCHARTMISDFGLCKKITNGRMSFSRRSGGIPGTDGWIAPEVLKNLEKHSPSQSLRMSYSVDIFSLGCVYYYVLTNGEHPFGEPFKRQSNIVNGESGLEKVKSNPQGVYDLINLMISSDANMRPPLADVMTHPMFWTKDKILAFFLDVSDRVEKEDESKCLLLRRLETDGTRIVREDWRDHICPEVAMDLRRYRTYKGTSVRDLLRALRNKKNHYRELTPEAQASLGHIPDQFTEYWISRFPDLLPYSWLKFEAVRKETIFTKYYPKEFSFNAFINNGDSFDEQSDLYTNNDMMVEELDENCDSLDGTRLQVRSSSSGSAGGSPEKSPRIDKNFWRAKSQFKYNKWRQRQQQNPNVRENPHNFTSFGTTRYPPQPSNNNDFNSMSSSPDSDRSWRNPVPKDK